MNTYGKFNEFEKINRNLYKKGRGYYRLFGINKTPNSCWVTAPRMVKIYDISIRTGKYIYDAVIIAFDLCGTVTSDNEFVTFRLNQDNNTMEYDDGPLGSGNLGKP